MNANNCLLRHPRRTSFSYSRPHRYTRYRECGGTFGRGTSAGSLVLVLLLLCLVGHMFDPLLGWVALVVGDSDDGRFPGGLIGMESRGNIG